MHSFLKDSIWSNDLVDMQLITKFNKEIRFLLCIIDIIINMHGLFLKNIKKALHLLILIIIN